MWFVRSKQWNHFGVGEPPVLVYLRDVHRGYGLLTHGQMRPIAGLLLRPALRSWHTCRHRSVRRSASSKQAAACRLPQSRTPSAPSATASCSGLRLAWAFMTEESSAGTHLALLSASSKVCRPFGLTTITWIAYKKVLDRTISWAMDSSRNTVFDPLRNTERS